MPNANVRANARTMPTATLADPAELARLRDRLEVAVQRLIDALDALDRPEEDLEEGDSDEDIADMPHDEESDACCADEMTGSLSLQHWQANQQAAKTALTGIRAIVRRQQGEGR